MLRRIYRRLAKNPGSAWYWWAKDVFPKLEHFLGLFTPVRIFGILVFAALVGWLLIEGFTWEELSANAFAELASLTLTVLLVDFLINVSAQKGEQKDLILQMGSTNNAFALEAVRKLRARRWLPDRFSKRSILSWADLEQANLKNVDLSYRNLNNVYMSRANLKSAFLSYAHFRNADMVATNFSKADLFSTDFEGANLEDSKFKEVCGFQTHFEQANLKGSNFMKADLSYSYFTNSILEKANFQYSTVSNADFTKSNLREAMFFCARGKEPSFLGADLTDAFFLGASFEEAKFSKNSLQNSIVSRSDLDKYLGKGKPPLCIVKLLGLILGDEYIPETEGAMFTEYHASRIKEYLHNEGISDFVYSYIT